MARVSVDKALERALAARKVRRVGKKTAAFLDARETSRRYGGLPREVKHLLALADRWELETAGWKNARYLRAEPDGWAMPAETKAEPLLATVMRRFDWNVFANMQLWEHFAGLVTIAVHQSSGRFSAALFEDDDGKTPVFYIDHETARIEGCVAASVRGFVAAMMGEAKVPEAERRLVLTPEHWDRREDDPTDAYLSPTLPLRCWPRFLSRRADWIVSLLMFGAADARSHLEAPEATCFDVKKEVDDITVNEPLALYWLMRSFLLEERDVFEEAVRLARKHRAPLVRSCAAVVRSRWDEPKADSSLIKARAALASLATPRRPAWSRPYARSQL